MSHGNEKVWRGDRESSRERFGLLLGSEGDTEIELESSPEGVISEAGRLAVS